MRLDKFLCETQGVSRSIAGNMVKKGRVFINQKRAASPSLKIKPNEDNITLDSKDINAVTGFRYFMMYKPEGVVCANQDSEHSIVFDLMQTTINLQTLHTVGRLDIDTTGLLFITDDGQWSHALTSPKHQHDKTYRAWLAEPLIDDAEARCREGIMLNNENHSTKPAKLQRVTNTEVLLTISEGRYHQVKRMFAALGNRVIKLHRENISGVQLDENLKLGEYRELTTEEKILLGIGA
ncbi:MAG: 16S rRNA pseudouridine516 synthase [Bermanella sp.]|jgi:16S rRNA pseudouridine516 synthase